MNWGTIVVVVALDVIAIGLLVRSIWSVTKERPRREAGPDPRGGEEIR